MRQALEATKKETIVLQHYTIVYKCSRYKDKKLCEVFSKIFSLSLNAFIATKFHDSSLWNLQLN